jgi:dynactin complex subunit
MTYPGRNKTVSRLIDALSVGTLSTDEVMKMEKDKKKKASITRRAKTVETRNREEDCDDLSSYIEDNDSFMEWDNNDSVPYVDRSKDNILHNSDTVDETLASSTDRAKNISGARTKLALYRVGN